MLQEGCRKMYFYITLGDFLHLLTKRKNTCNFWTYIPIGGKYFILQVNNPPITKIHPKFVNFNRWIKIAHFLFGGKRNSVTTLNNYLARLKQIDGPFMCNFELFDQDTPCNTIPHSSKLLITGVGRIGN